MVTNSFCRYDLRTTDPEAARRFYAEVARLDLTETLAPAGPSMLRVGRLHDQARARGAPPHWLGHIGVGDVEATVTRLLALGSERLGPTVQGSDGAAYVTLRDTSGAVIAIGEVAKETRRSPVAWHHHHTRDRSRAWEAYSDVFGWVGVGAIETPGADGVYQLFAWESSGDPVGSMANTARMAGVHPHWLYFFDVADLDGAVARVYARGGEIIADPATLPNGDRVVPCHDPQGAAFGLCQMHSRA